MDTRSHFTGAHHAWRETAALANAEGPVRSFVVGPAGSGKSTLLGQLQDLLTLGGVHSTPVDDVMDIDAFPATEVLVVDDLHLVQDERAEALLARSAIPSAAMVVASRPLRCSPRSRQIARNLERGAPPIVLGHVSLADVTEYLENRQQGTDPACLDHILDVTAGVSWLVSRALAIHEAGPCEGPTHASLIRDLEARIQHRLDTGEEALRRWVELSCLSGFGHAGFPNAEVSASALAAEAFAEGLLLRNGNPVPVVRSAVRGALPAHRVVDLGRSGREVDGRGAAAVSTDGWAPIDHPDLIATLLGRADHLIDTDPERAGDLCAAALASGATKAEVMLRQARAAWHGGALDQASGLLDVLLADGPTAGVADVAAAVWSARGFMATSSTIYSALPPDGLAAQVRAVIAHVGAGASEELAPATRTDRRSERRRPLSAPSTLDVALRMLEEGVRTSLLQEPPSHTITSLVRASDLYTSSKSTEPLPELPAVIAASAALCAGEVSTAHNVIDAAVDGAQGGLWARRRLLLWQSFVELQGERPADARASLAAAMALSTPVSPRDEFLHQSMLVSLARRYEDLAALEARWAEASEVVRHFDVDLYTLLPLSALVPAAARVGDATTLAAHVAQGRALLGRLGTPPIWSMHLRWAAVQQGILLNRPDLLGPDAKALVAASQSSAIARVMAHAGGVWVAVLGGTVDPEGVEEAARTLSTVGLAWDGARLAAHGAERVEDRRVSARLLNVARQLHPASNDVSRSESDTPAPIGAPRTGDARSLSDRELEVAVLVLEGKTYAEIGKRIFISPRTVEHHVSHIKRRLSVTSRSDLLAKLRLTIDQDRSLVPSELG